jgi:gliding motility-associated-like protein
VYGGRTTGGGEYDQGWSTTRDATGNVYLAGSTKSTTVIATTGAHQTSFGGGPGVTFGDHFLVKFSNSGVREWGTYFGGEGDDWGTSTSTDAMGNVYLSGCTNSTTGIATIGAYQDTYGGGDNEAFLVKFNSSGVRQWGTYYGGEDYEYCGSTTTDAMGNVYLSGYTRSTSGIATTGAYQTTYTGSTDAFLVKFNSSGVLQWGTYYGGDSDDLGWSTSTDTIGNVYLSGGTMSTTGIATTSVHQTTYGGGMWDAFLVKFNSSGVRQWGTYCGGEGTDEGLFSTTDATGNVYLAGYTMSTAGISTIGAHQITYGGSIDAFLVKFNSSGVRQWGTYYGGDAADPGTSISTDALSNVYLSGFTSSTTVIATIGAHQITYGGGSRDAFLVKFNSSGVRQWGTYYGGEDDEYGGPTTADAIGNVLLVGSTLSTTGISTTGAHQATKGGFSDAFLVKFNDQYLNLTPSQTNVTCNGASNGSASVAVSGGTAPYTYAWSPSGGTGSSATNLKAGVYTVTVTDASAFTTTQSVTITEPTVIALTPSQTNVTCNGASNGSVSVAVSGGTAPYTYAWSPSGGTGSSATNLTAGIYTVTVTDASACTATQSFTITEPTVVALTPSQTNVTCNGASNGSASVVVTGGTGPYTYAWSPSGGTGASATNLTSGIYMVTVTDVSACTTTQSFTITEPAAFSMLVQPSTASFNLGDSVALTVTGAENYSWSPVTGLSCTLCSSPYASPTQTTSYVVTGKDASGCMETATVNIMVKEICNDLYVPTAFAPEAKNTNPENGKLCVYGSCITSLNYSVYDRWGNKVFETSNMDLCWDGTYKGKEISSGVYSYMLVVILNNGKRIEQSGNVSLIR